MFDILGEVAADRRGTDHSVLVWGASTSGLADLIGDYRVAATRLANFRLVLVAAWADRHPGEVEGGGSMLVERPLTVGGDQTPAVGEGGVDELGDLLGVGYEAARKLIADVLDLRHRLPRLWQKVCVGGVPEWQARKIAQLTRPLDAAAAAMVDRRLDAWTGQLGWSRLERLVDAEVVAADPARAAQLAGEAAAVMGVWAGRVNQARVRTIVAKTDPGSAAWFLGLVERIADLLAADGDTRSADRRRAAAIGILAQPARACALLAAHAHDASPRLEPDRSPRPELDASPRPELVEGRGGQGETVGLFDAAREPDPDGEESCVAEWVDTGGPDVRPMADDGVPVEPDDQSCRCGAATDRLDPDARLGVTPPTGDLRAARPRVVLHFHVSDGAVRTVGGDAVVRPEHAEPMLLRELLGWLAGTGCQVRVQPVIDPARTAPADAYEIPDRIRHAVGYRQIADVSPWGRSMRRSLDFDHVIPYRTGGPPGQTSVTNLAPLTRSAHRVKTLGLKRVRQPDPGLYLWRTRHGHLFLVTNRGTLDLGRTAFTRALWQLAAEQGRSVEPVA